MECTSSSSSFNAIVKKKQVERVKQQNMGLLTVIKKQKMKDKELRSLVLGLDNSGKSTVVDWLLERGEKRSRITPTVGFRIHTIEYAGHNVQLWDIGGQRTLRPFWDNYFDKTDVLLWVIDVTARSRFSESFAELEKLLQDRDRLGYRCKMIVLLNKMDLIDEDESVTDDVRRAVIERFSLVNTPVVVVPCSGLTGFGLGKLLEVVVSQ